MSAALTATYRLQFHSGFTFVTATNLVPYFADLGISHIYASPIFRAAPGSQHGYDICDHNELNPAIGSQADFEAFASALKAHGLGLIIDFVPNHMGIEHALNPWWRDVLENGISSRYARYFDIDWLPLKRELENKVLLPVLADQYGRILEADQFRVEFADGTFALRHGEHSYPLDPSTTASFLREASLSTGLPAELESVVAAIESLPLRTETDAARITERSRERRLIRDRLLRLCDERPTIETAIHTTLERFHDPSDPARFDRLDDLICRQAYRLSSWRVAGEEINYRRFFDVNTLAALRMDLPEVFAATHRLVLRLSAAGFIDGLRIDHIDGLALPRDYLRRLRDSIGESPLIFVEKILAPDETLPSDWPVSGSTGYEFASEVTHLLVNQAKFPMLATIYERFLGYRIDFREAAYEGKKLVMQSSMASEVNVLGHILNRISESHRWYRDFTLNALTTAVRELIACFPVYRTYIDPASPASDTDARVIQRALGLARKRNPALERTVFHFLRDVLLPPKNHARPVDEELRRNFVLRFQQCTGAITAKGVEDTAFYVFNPLIALNEVGGLPIIGQQPLETFHQRNADRLTAHPQSLLASSTHDTKRSEDVRARIIALSELPDEWRKCVRRWQRMNRKHRKRIDDVFAPDANEEYLIYQTLIGAWPIGGLKNENREDFTTRMQAFGEKAVREAKINSSWLEPNAHWDDAVRDFIGAILSADGRNRFPPSIAPLALQIAKLGAVNSLTQTVLKLTCPGTPDLYQGTELWDLSLVDPDNRRPVDFDVRQKLLASIEKATPSELLDQWEDGRIKLFTIQRLLALRKQHVETFRAGAYTPISATGTHSERVISFMRHDERTSVVVVVPRHTADLGFPPIGARWEDTRLPAPNYRTPFRDVFTGREYADDPLLVAEVFSELPFAVLVQSAH